MAVATLSRVPQHRRELSKGRLSHKPDMGPAVPSRWMTFFLGLPEPVRDCLFQHLDYTTSCNLAMVCRFFADSVQPWRADVEDKVAAVFQAERYFAQHFPGTGHDREDPKAESQGNFGCFLCHRVRGPEHFDSEQPTTAIMHQIGLRPDVIARSRRTYRGCAPDKCVQHDAVAGGARGDRALWLCSCRSSLIHAAGDFTRDDDRRLVVAKPSRRVHLRRFCVECGVQTNLHRTGDQLTTKTGRELWVCSCRCVWVKGNTLSSRQCPRCGDRCLSSVKSSRHTPTRAVARRRQVHSLWT